ncbi:7-cyano-7-deazaguanine synthase [Striga asiatica]|uniref:7-cyano-7-deazaguanine synthase n=1 Tax=Striga asiatica TaxID=4170 RepID=A0A5A7Q445_STRAF|nr:7-cyano-7-deazaguanine synthase [Striga asiatica]
MPSTRLCKLDNWFAPMTVVWPKKVQASQMLFENMPTAEVRYLENKEARLLRSKYPNQISTPIKLKSRVSQYTLCRKKRNTNTGRKRLLGHRSALVSAWLISEKGSSLCTQSNAFRGRSTLWCCEGRWSRLEVGCRGGSPEVRCELKLARMSRNADEFHGRCGAGTERGFGARDIGLLWPLEFEARCLWPDDAFAMFVSSK